MSSSRQCRYCGKTFIIHGIGTHEKYCPKRTSKASKLVYDWEHREDNILPIKHFAYQIDKKVEITKIQGRQVTIYSFSDGSTLTTVGKDQNFTMKEIPHNDD